jgi:hypothetical protein
LIEILALLLAIALLLFLFKHRLTGHSVRRSKKNNKYNTPHANISELAPIANEPEPVALTTNKTSTHPYHSVEIIDGSGICSSANALKGKRYLSQDAPKLPLPGCLDKECNCRYLHHQDRRKDSEDRRMDFGVSSELFGVFGETNRRGMNRKGRRRSDSSS